MCPPALGFADSFSVFFFPCFLGPGFIHYSLFIIVFLIYCVLTRVAYRERIFRISSCFIWHGSAVIGWEGGESEVTFVNSSQIQDLGLRG
jgi:hypothetical protein